MEEFITINASHASDIFGPCDAYIKKIERSLKVSIVNRDDKVVINGSDANVRHARAVLETLVALRNRGNAISEQDVDYSIAMSMEEQQQEMLNLDKDLICHTINGRPIKPKTVGQSEYINAIRNNMIVFGLGPAGTGKTYLAMAMAITAFKNGEVERIILTRPAIEAGEKLGFLPGDLQSKVDPYLRPLYDALYQIMGADSFNKNMEKGLIEVAPLAYMRGRTLDNAYIILDEAQNTTPAQMKMFLTRIGFGSKVIVTGDMTQKDLASNVKSGLEVALKVLKNIEGISFITLTSKDVVRHPLVMKIVQAYDKYESRQKRSSSDKR
ncbi:PhoH family protein [Lacrimispora saccharolytica]|uniref:PhoH family protein n=1 Tax=Lacrimispora saccharolytica TaxID=84030 RepID=UPI00265CED38|nr:PhoH family protein [Lacrimispora saccharolytica]MCF2656170.1 PhoH family protein [Lacrimispora saccharolytica]